MSKSLVENIFNPKMQAQAASGNLGKLGGAQGRSFGHLGTDFGDLGADQIKYNAEDYFDVNDYYKPDDYYDPTQLVKRY